MKPVLYVGNKNYSSWSLRPWLALTWSGIPFETRAIQLGGEGYGEGRTATVLAVSPSGRVPALHLGGGGDAPGARGASGTASATAVETETVVWDSLAIAEWAAENAPAAHLWPEDPVARAVCRSAACEMHAGFAALRSKLPCNIRRRAPPREPARHAGEAVQHDIARVEALWAELRGRFGKGGPYLFGAKPTVADAFYAPVATRFRTYAVPIAAASQAYVDAILKDPAFLAWEKDGIAEAWTMPQWDDY
ncbi:MAG TPA: glutathione S-transferase [Polyangiaceae bacterium]|jgi:glutathione S-transferase